MATDPKPPASTPQASAHAPRAPLQATQLLQQIEAGDKDAPARLLPLVYDEFRSLARHYLQAERPNHTLQPTALVHEAYIRLVDQSRVNWQGRTHFFAVAALAMRRILVDHARAHLRVKRGGPGAKDDTDAPGEPGQPGEGAAQGAHRITLDEAVALSPQREENVLALDEALEKLARLDPRQSKVVELRFFGGLSVAEVAEALNISKRTVEADWTMARAWLLRELQRE